MAITLSKRKIIFWLIFLLTLTGIVLLAVRQSGRSLAQAAGFDSGRSAALAGAQAFYSVDYHDSPERWAARLCAVSTLPACEYFQNTVAPFIWQAFTDNQTVVSAQAGQPVMVADEKETESSPRLQVWRVTLTLSAPWPQGDGQTEFPAYAVVVRGEQGWKFERFLLAEETARFNGGEK